jgi:hypothetical protein
VSAQEHDKPGNQQRACQLFLNCLHIFGVIISTITIANAIVTTGRGRSTAPVVKNNRSWQVVSVITNVSDTVIVALSSVAYMHNVVGIFFWFQF